MASDLLSEHLVDPLGLCRVILTIASLQNDIYVFRKGKASFGALLTSLTTTISLDAPGRVRQRVQPEVDACVYACTKMNERLPEFAPADLVQLLIGLQASGEACGGA